MINTNIYYAGIGSRETPSEIITIFEYLGEWLAKRNYILRSGHADGADIAFERGCARVQGQMEIYLPWNGFNGSTSQLIFKHSKAVEIAREFHPRFDSLSQGAQKLQARNSYQVLGYSLDKPSSFIICWTENGSGKGGTGQALRIAKHYNIPVFDFGKYNKIKEAETAFNQFITNINKK